jgi:hypothetical protein
LIICVALQEYVFAMRVISQERLCLCKSTKHLKRGAMNLTPPEVLATLSSQAQKCCKQELEELLK